MKPLVEMHDLWHPADGGGDGVVGPASQYLIDEFGLLFGRWVPCLQRKLSLKTIIYLVIPKAFQTGCPFVSYLQYTSILDRNLKIERYKAMKRYTNTLDR